VLATPDGHVPSNICSGSLPVPVVAPLLFLFFVSTAQGKTLFGSNVLTISFLSCSDRLLVWWVFMCSFLCMFLHRGTLSVVSSPAVWLGKNTNALSYLSCPTSLFFQTEVARIQGGGLAMLPSLARSSWLCTFTFCKAMVCLCVICFLV